MSYFTKEFQTYFKELSQHNNKEWFHKNKQRYEKFVKEPFYEFVSELIYRLQEFEPELETNPKQAIFRINKDMRFSKDKTPYKTRVAASIKAGGRMNHNEPGYFIHLESEKVAIGGGLYNLEKEGLYKIRTHITNYPDKFSKLIKEKKFIKNFGTIQGDKNKRMPPEFKKIFEKQPLIANKNFYYNCELDPNIILESQFMDKLIDYYENGHKINSFFREAFTI